MVLILLLLLIASTAAQSQVTPNPVCTPVKPGPAIPSKNLGSEFSVRMEIVTEETNRVTNIRMYYSQPRNQIRLSMLDSGVRSDMYFYFGDNEILTFDYSSGRGSCSVNPNLANASDTFIVGGAKDGKIQLPLAVLHLIGESGFGSNIQAVSIGTQNVREMDVDAYYSCQKWTFGQQSAIVNVTHYFSAKTWSRPDPAIVPVMIEIHGSAVLHNKVVAINHMYNFFDFQTSVVPTIFETPPGIMCTGRNNDLLFPNLPSYIKFSGESVDPTSSSVSYFEEIYDSDDDFVVVRSQTSEDYGTQGGMSHITIIRDYPTGLSYTIDNTMQVCTTQNITDSTPLPFDSINPQGKVTEITPDQLFFKANAKYEYIGERNVRGILADTWVTKTNIPAYPNAEVTVEWYFAKTDVTSWNDGSPYYTANKFRMPVLMRIWPSDTDIKSVDTNIYHADFTKVMYGQLDIRDCYPERQSNFFQIVLNGAKELVINTNIDQFKWSTVNTLAMAANVRWIRIADLKIYYDVNDAVIEFELLDAPSYASDISSPTVQSVSLQQATQNLQNVVTSGKLVIMVWDSATNQINKPITASTNVKLMANTPSGDSSDSTYSAGAMAGLGLAMLIVGGVGSGVGAHFFFK